MRGKILLNAAEAGLGSRHQDIPVAVRLQDISERPCAVEKAFRMIRVIFSDRNLERKSCRIGNQRCGCPRGAERIERPVCMRIGCKIHRIRGGEQPVQLRYDVRIVQSAVLTGKEGGLH